ncbi:MAG TPA: hypothetical protein PKL77_09530 [Candidatus Omnitrophota bacterium]|nr:hypothetical protein [Candidatus Omnitrophota bacterium]
MERNYATMARAFDVTGRVMMDKEVAKTLELIKGKKETGIETAGAIMRVTAALVKSDPALAAELVEINTEKSAEEVAQMEEKEFVGSVHKAVAGIVINFFG